MAPDRSDKDDVVIVKRREYDEMLKASEAVLAKGESWCEAVRFVEEHRQAIETMEKLIWFATFIRSLGVTAGAMTALAYLIRTAFPHWFGGPPAGGKLP